MDCRGCWCERYLQNIPPKRLLIYGIIVVVVFVTITFLIIPSSETPETQPTPEPSGRNILHVVPLVDGYNALPVQLMAKFRGDVKDFHFNTNTSTDDTTLWCRTNIPALQKGLVGTQVFTVKSPCDSQYKDASSRAIQQIDALGRLVDMYPNEMKKIVSSDEISRTKEEGKLGMVVGLDGGQALDNKLALLRTYYNLGVRYVTLNSECSTPWSSSYTAKEDNKTIILTDFGKTIVQEMNRLGMIIDLSRSSKKTQLAVLNETRAPVIFTATAAFNVTPILGNVDDEVLNHVGKNGGLIMITFNARSVFPNTNLSASRMTHVVNHINYIRQKVGVDHVGLAAGFHQTASVPITSLSDSSKYPALFDRLASIAPGEPKWTSEDLKKLAGLNFIRVWKSVEEMSRKMEDLPIDLLIHPEDIPDEKKACYSEL